MFKLTRITSDPVEQASSARRQRCAEHHLRWYEHGTQHRLDVGELLPRSLANTNPIESCLSTVGRVARNVKRWHAGDQALRWTATDLLKAASKFRKVKGFRELPALQRKLNPALIQQAQVAEGAVLREPPLSATLGAISSFGGERVIHG